MPSEVVAVPTRNVVITDHQQQLVESLVESGRYQNASEVLRAGLRLIEEREAQEAEKLRLLREAVNAGFTDVAAGRYIDIATEEDQRAFWAGVETEVDTRVASRAT
jgi:antitoxin ParD1/3/4